IFSSRGSHQFQSSAINGNRVKISEITDSGKPHAFGRGLPIAANQKLRVVGSKVISIIIGTVISDSRRFSTFSGHGIYIKIPIPVAGICNGLAVVAPHRMLIIGIAGGQGSGHASIGTHAIEIAHISENDTLPIRRNCRIAQPACRIVLGKRKKRYEQEKTGEEKCFFHKNREVKLTHKYIQSRVEMEMLNLL